MHRRSIFLFALPALLACLLLATSAHAGKPNLKFKKCKKADEAQIEKAWQWVIDHVDDIAAKMGKDGLSKMSAKQKARYKKKLEKKTNVRCIDDKKSCKNSKVDGYAIPILHQKKIHLCTKELNARRDPMREYVIVIAHELAHLVKIQAHRTNCEKYYRNPRFAQSIDLATDSIYSKGSVKSRQDYFVGAVCDPKNPKKRKK